MEKIEKWINDNGCGYGCGCGSGRGDGDGDGYGCDDGSGDGDGYGYGCGYGSGDGYGIKEFMGKKVYIIDGLQTLIDHVSGAIAKGSILYNDLSSLQPCYIAKGDGYFAHGETIEKARDALRKKIFDNMNPEEAIEAFLDKFEKEKKYPCSDFYEWHHYLTGSCQMGRDSFMQNKGITFDDLFTVDEFISLCEDEYGNEIILQLKGQWEAKP